MKMNKQTPRTVSSIHFNGRISTKTNCQRFVRKTSLNKYRKSTCSSLLSFHQKPNFLSGNTHLQFTIGSADLHLPLDCLLGIGRSLLGTVRSRLSRLLPLRSRSTIVANDLFAHVGCSRRKLLGQCQLETYVHSSTACAFQRRLHRSSIVHSTG